MAEELNVHFSSVFTREDTSSLPLLPAPSDRVDVFVWSSRGTHKSLPTYTSLRYNLHYLCRIYIN